MFCDFENIALGVRDAKYDRFDLEAVLGRVLLKGNIVVKKAYADWERYKGFKPAMHEAAFELIEIPHVRQSGKNSADIRMVVDALDLCYTKSHLDTFVILSGDSDFSPLVSKLRENNKYVVGIGVKSSTSDLLSGNCDEFIYYDDLARPKRQPVRKKKTSRAGGVSKTGASKQDEQRRQRQRPARAALRLELERAREGARELGAAGPAGGRVLGEGPRAERGQIRGHLGAQLGQGRRGFALEAVEE